MIHNWWAQWWAHRWSGVRLERRDSSSRNHLQVQGLGGVADLDAVRELLGHSDNQDHSALRALGAGGSGRGRRYRELEGVGRIVRNLGWGGRSTRAGGGAGLRGVSATLDELRPWLE